MFAMWFVLFLLVSIGVFGAALHRSSRFYREKLREAENMKCRGDLSGAADVYLVLLEAECARSTKNVRRIVYLTDCVRPLLARTRRTEEERRILGRSMRLCLSATQGRSWDRWQRRLAQLDRQEEDGDTGNTNG